jgi:hypothetical protein
MEPKYLEIIIGAQLLTLQKSEDCVATGLICTARTVRNM